MPEYRNNILVVSRVFALGFDHSDCSATGRKSYLGFERVMLVDFLVLYMLRY